jgi:hypothetical protein
MVTTGKPNVRLHSPTPHSNSAAVSYHSIATNTRPSTIAKYKTSSSVIAPPCLIFWERLYDTAITLRVQAIIILCSLTYGCSQPSAPQPTITINIPALTNLTEPKFISRHTEHFTIITAGRDTIRLETTTGRTWELAAGMWMPIPDTLPNERLPNERSENKNRTSNFSTTNETEKMDKPSAEQFLNEPEPPSAAEFLKGYEPTNTPPQ